MKLIAYLTIVLTFLFTHHASANTEPDFTTLICKLCYSNTDYERAASYINDGKVVVVNPKNYQAKAFDIIFEPMLGGSNPVPADLPEGVQEALGMYEELVVELNNFQFNQANTQITGSLQQSMTSNLNPAWRGASACSANGCGTGWNLYFVQDFPFADACNLHDTCYCSDSPKAACDTAFLENMRNSVQELINNNFYIRHNKFLHYLLEISFNTRANVYYQAVKQAPGALSAYCASNTAESPGECNSEIMEGTTQGEMFTTVNHVFKSTGNSNDGINVICELWRYPDGAGGFYYLIQNCISV